VRIAGGGGCLAEVRGSR